MRSLATGLLSLIALGSGPYSSAADFNGDGKDDIAIFRESIGLWAVKGVTRDYFGGKLDIPVPGDYGGGDAAEIAIFRPSSGLWAAKGVTRVYFGASGDIPLGQSGLKESDNFFYDPAKWAFRAGRASLGQWNDLNVGDYSMALGADVTASGRSAIALGTAIEVSGDYSFGYGTLNSWGEDVSADDTFVIHGADVGIGTTSPSARLHVLAPSGDNGLVVSTSGAAAPDAIFETTSANNFDLMFRKNSSDTGKIIAKSSGLQIIAQNNLNLELTDDSGNGIVVEDGGNIGIGISNPGTPLDVAANRNGYVAKFVNDGNNSNRSGIYIKCGSDTGIGNSFLAGFFDGDGGEVGGIYFSGGTVTYGTFTADHEASIPEGKNKEGYPYGTVMSLQAVRANPKRPRQVDYRVEPSRKAYDQAVFGVYAGKHEDKENTHTIYALGDGQILVTGEGGDIEVGDYLTTSSREGHAMKQDKPMLYNYTVAKALENVDWENEGNDTRLIACTYHAQ